MVLILLVFSSIVAAAAEHTNERLVEEWFARQRARWWEITLRCDTIILLFTDSHWADMTAELMIDLARFGAYDDCIAMWYWLSPNQIVSDYSHLKMPLFIDTRSAIEFANESSATATSWGSRRYFNKIAQRVPIAKEVLYRIPLLEVGLAIVDSDIALFRNVFKRMEREAATLVIQQESICSSGRTKCVNGGFWRVAGDEEGAHLLNDVSRTMQDLHIPDQDAFDIVLSRPRKHRKVVYLDRLKYANGYVYKNDPAWLRNAAHIVHANWCNGLAEKRALLINVRGRRPLNRTE